VIDNHAIKNDGLSPEVSGTVRGQWGFETFEGPTFHLQTARSVPWTLAPADQSAMVVGRDDVLHLKSDAVACVQNVVVKDASGKTIKTTHKVVSPSELQVDVSLKDVTPGPLTLQVKLFGLAKPDEVLLHSYAEAGHLDSFTIDAGDHQGVLKGTRLDEVAGLELNGIQFTPAGLNRVNNEDELHLSASATADVSSVRADQKQSAKVSLKDGRTLDLAVTINQPRPKVTLISKSVQPESGDLATAIQVQGQEELPQNGQLSFALKTQVPATFPRDEKIEVATQDESVNVILSIADGTLMLQDSQTVLASLDPLKSLGASAFGPLRFRPIAGNGEKGDWQPLVTLVRLPALKELRCPDVADMPCTLAGTSLYLLDSISADPQFQQSTPVPDGFAGSTLSVSRPSGNELYVKLRDDPSVIHPVTVSVLPE
jgi:hypothetical protein